MAQVRTRVLQAAVLALAAAPLGAWGQEVDVNVTGPATGRVYVVEPPAGERPYSRGGPHHGPAASGFMIESLVGGNVALNVGEQSPLVAPSLRIGAMLRPLAIAVNLSYFSVSSFADGYSARNLITAGIDVMPVLWRSAFDHARLYLLIGANVGGVVDTNFRTSAGTNASASNIAGGFSLGVGGRYFLHRNFALGAEIGNRTEFLRPGDTTNVVSTMYGALLATFVAGR